MNETVAMMNIFHLMWDSEDTSLFMSGSIDEFKIRHRFSHWSFSHPKRLMEWQIFSLGWTVSMKVVLYSLTSPGIWAVIQLT
ncbi:hypothetical protein COOONC_27403 [Cooperia oncophora]